MARPPVWLDRLHEIRRSVSNTVGSHYKCSELEDLFQVQGRTARNLMSMLPRYPAGSTFEVQREDLQKFLDRVHAADDVHELFREIRAEKPKVLRRKIRTRRRDDGTLEPVLPPRPGELTLERGRAELTWKTPEEFMQTMLRLVLKLGDDQEGFIRDYCVEEPKPLPKALTVQDEAEFGEWRETQEPEPQSRTIDLRAIARENERAFNAWMAARRSKPDRRFESSSGMQMEGLETEAFEALIGTP